MKHFLTRVVPLCIALVAPHAAAAFDEGTTIDYVPFNMPNEILTLHQHKGKYVELLLSDDWEAALTDEERRLLLDRADITYQYFKELMGTEPRLRTDRDTIGLLRIAVSPFVPAPNLAWTNNSWRELEIKEIPENLAQLKAELARGLETNRNIMVHEMAHAFDVYNNLPDDSDVDSEPERYLQYDFTCTPGTTTNWCHAWTNFWDGFLPYYGRNGGIQETVNLPDIDQPGDQHLGWWTDHSYLPYYENPSANWETCVRDDLCSGGITARDTWAGVMFRYVQLYGVEAMTNALAYLKWYSENFAPPDTKEGREHLHVMMLAEGAQSDIKCLLEAWNWYLTPDLIAELGDFPPSPYCISADTDSNSVLDGDCDDSPAAIHPGATELGNGIDDDCDGVIDDLKLTEPGTDFPATQAVALPQRIQGAISSSTDADTFVFDVTSPVRVDFRVKSSAFSGWFTILNADDTLRETRPIVAGRMFRAAFDLTEIRQWKVRLDQASVTGAYDFTIAPVPALPLDYWADLSPATKDGLDYVLHSSTLTLDEPVVNEDPTHIRFWVTGVGVVGTVPYSDEATVLWRPTADLAPGTYGYRAQLLSGVRPASEWTSLEWFEYAGPCTTNSQCNDGNACTVDTCNTTAQLCNNTPPVKVYEAEAMTRTTGNAYPEGWNLYDNNGYAGFEHTFIGGVSYRVTVRAAGQYGQGWPSMRMTVGSSQTYNQSVTTSGWKDYPFMLPNTSGAKQVRTSLTNDLYLPNNNPPVDRNLLVDKVTVECITSLPVPPSINLGAVNQDTTYTVNGVQDLTITQLTFNGWTPARIVLGIAQTDGLPMDGISVSVNGGTPIALSGDWRRISIPYTGQTVINISVYSATPRSLTTEWWAEG